MSVKVSAWVLDQRFEPTDLAIMLILANWANDDGYCYPGQTKILSKIDMSQRTLIRRLADLEERGLIRRERRHRNGGQRTSDAYWILMDGESLGDNLSPDTRGSDQVPTVSPTRDTSGEPSGTGLDGGVDENQSRPRVGRGSTDSSLGSIQKHMASQAGIRSIGVIVDLIAIHCQRTVSASGALTVSLNILGKAKQHPAAPDRYVGAAIRREPFVWQKYIDEAGLAESPDERNHP